MPTAILVGACAPAIVAAWALFGPDGRIEPDDDEADYEYGDLGI